MMSLVRIGALLGALALALPACSSGGATLPLQSSVKAPGTSQVTPPARIYVGSRFGGGVQVFDSSANGNVAPLFTIAGPPGCGFIGVSGIAVDSLDTLYISDIQGFIDTFRLLPADGAAFVDALPLPRPNGLAVDNSNNLYVAKDTHEIREYTPGSTGVLQNVAVIRGPATDLAGGPTMGVAVDAAGEIFALVGNPALNKGIRVFPPHANGNAAPVREISGPNTGLSRFFSTPLGIAADAAGNVYVADAAQLTPGILVYAAGANGDVAPIAHITGPNTTLEQPAGVAVDSTGKIYVADGIPGRFHSEVAVFAAGANGNVAPISVIIGPKTGLLSPGGITVR